MEPSRVAPDFGLDGKVAFVTGASRGIGRACALACAGAGADVILGVRSPERAEEVVEAVRRSDGGPPP